MDNKEANPVKSYTGIRPPALTLLCLLTFTWSGISAFGFVLVYVLYDGLLEMMEQSTFPEQQELVIAMIKNSDRIFFLLIGLLNIASLTGAIFMWKLHKGGFHLYTISQLLILVIPFFLVAGYSITLSNAIITAVFILAYAVNIPQMR